MTPTTELTRKEKRVKIAEALGWKKKSVRTFGPTNPAVIWWTPPGHDQASLDGPPDYFGDLNAAHAMEKALSATQWPGYVTLLCGITSDINGEGLVHATAAQRAEAFGLTMGLWTANREDTSK